jgi:hypothetical protein
MRTFQDQRDTSSKKEMATVILQIPISQNGSENFASWPIAKFGLYYVRSAYKLACTESFFSTRTTAGRGSNSGIENQTKDWKKLWAIQAPNKMNILLWRMAHDCLPIGFQLQHKHIPTKDECIFCGKSERVNHLFLMCLFARSVWKSVNEAFPICLARKSLRNMKQWSFDFLRRSSHACSGNYLCCYMRAHMGG